MTILIVDALAGFSEAMCRAFTAAGFNAVGATRRIEKLQTLAEELSGSFYPLRMGVADTLSVPAALQSPPEGLKETDRLISNAGLALGLDSTDKANFADRQTVIQTNIVGPTSLACQTLPQTVERKSGHIINIGSIAGNYPYPGGNVCGATEAFVRQLNLNLRVDLAGTGIRVTDIEPGLCGGAESSNVCLKGDGERTVGVYENIRFIRPEDIADTALWLYHHPARMNVNTIEIMPVAQSFGASSVVHEIPPALGPEESFGKQSTSLFAEIKSWFK